QLFAQVDDVDIDGAATPLAASRFDSVDKEPAKAATLSRGLDGQHSKIGSIARELQIDGSGDRARRLLEHEKLPRLHHPQNLVRAGPVADLEEGFNLEGVVDKPRKDWCVMRNRRSDGFDRPDRFARRYVRTRFARRKHNAGENLTDADSCASTVRTQFRSVRAATAGGRCARRRSRRRSSRPWSDPYEYRLAGRRRASREARWSDGRIAGALTDECAARTRGSS